MRALHRHDASRSVVILYAREFWKRIGRWITTLPIIIAADRLPPIRAGRADEGKDMREILIATVFLVATNSASALPPDITITNAKIQAGKLVVAGTTTSGKMKVRLEGQTGATFNVVSNATTRAFAFSIVYHPSDCVVILQKVNANNTLGPAVAAVVADCGPRGLFPRGAWGPNNAYLTNDVVTSMGSTWRAKRENSGKPPATSAADWEVLASSGRLERCESLGSELHRLVHRERTGLLFAETSRCSPNHACQGLAEVPLSPSIFCGAIDGFSAIPLVFR